ncbi:MAG: phage tail protein, partial [Deltaproteobacteria bacterium]|nr:phage tail protein [Deltaproteobacteria bacterium]
MATTKQQIKESYPIPAYYYSVSIQGEENSDMRFQEVSGLAIEYETITYKHGLSPKEGTLHIIGMGTPVDVTLKKGVMRKDSYLLNWIGTVKLNTVDKRDITVSLMDDEDKPVVTWKVIDAFPSKLEAPTFDASA